jgi:hypothetical protein
MFKDMPLAPCYVQWDVSDAVPQGKQGPSPDLMQWRDIIM